MTTDDRLDEALAFLAPFGPDLANGLTNHGPMAVEALVAMERSDAIGRFLDAYRKDLVPRLEPRGRIAAAEWRTALGREPLFPEWAALFREELASDTWREVLRRWSPRLAPGLAAAATHGVLRAGHAARALAARETPERVHELADGLGYWAATYQALPTSGLTAGRRTPAEAILDVERVPPEQRRFEGTITSSLAALDAHPPFARVAGAIAIADPGETVSALAETFGRVLLANASDFLTAIVFVHAVTSVEAVRSLLPYVDRAGADALVRHQWQTGAALYATFGERPPVEPPAAVSESWDDAIERAIASGDEHAIKITEACRREDLVAPSPVHRAAARHAIDLLAGSP